MYAQCALSRRHNNRHRRVKEQIKNKKKKRERKRERKKKHHDPSEYNQNANGTRDSSPRKDGVIHRRYIGFRDSRDVPSLLRVYARVT